MVSKNKSNLKKNKKKLNRMLLFSLIISVFSIIVITFFTSDENTVPSLLKIQPIYLLIAVILHFISYGIWGYRTTILCKSINEQLNILKSTEIMTSSLLMAAVTPSNAGGEPIRIFMLIKEGLSPGRASAIIVAERLFDAILLFLALPFALITLKNVSYELDTLLIIASFFVILIFVIIILSIINNTWLITNVVNIIQSLLYKFRLEQISDTFIKKIKYETYNFKESFILGATNGKLNLLLAFVITILFWFVEFMIIPIILFGLNVPNVFSLIPIAFAAQIILQIVMAIPLTPGSSGLAEFSSTALLSMFIPFHLIGIVVICWRAIMYSLNIIVGAFFSMKTMRERDYF